MKRLYATVSVDKPDSKSKIKYYEIEEQSYGVEIVKEVNEKVQASKIIDNITNEKVVINKVLDLLTRQLITPETIEYIEDDLIHRD